MTSDGRHLRILEAIAAEPFPSPFARLCAAAATRTASPGASVALVSRLDVHTVAATELGATGDRVQGALGVGPTFTCERSGAVVSAVDLAHDDRWLGLAVAARTAGIGAAFAFPVGSGDGFGTLTLYRRAAGDLASDERHEADLFARVAGDLLAGVTATTGLTGGEGGAPAGAGEDLGALDPAAGEEDVALAPGVSLDEVDTWVVHQASGMVSVQADLGVDHALALLRARAYATDRPLVEVAEDVVARRTSFAAGP